jgi:hypothetical protein
MPSTLPAFGDCCLPCESPATVSVPGPQGVSGTNGSDGSDGKNSYTFTTTEFVMPAVGAAVVVEVEDSRGFIVDQFIPVQFAGKMKVTAKPDTTHLTLRNDDYAPDNVVVGAVIPTSSIVGPPLGQPLQSMVYNSTTSTWYMLTFSGAVGEEVLSWEAV